jgi:hypothetical protein
VGGPEFKTPILLKKKKKKIKAANTQNIPQ